MRSSRWSIDARRQFIRWLRPFAAENTGLAQEATRLIEVRAEALAAHPFSGRPSRWTGLREASLPRWRKLLVYQVKRTEVVMIAFYDTRQDLSAVSPEPE